MNNKVKLLLILLLLVSIITIVSFYNIKNFSSISNDIDIYFFKTNDSDACIIKNDNSVIMIDTALSDYNEEIIDRLKNLNITKIDYLILSHFDKDHIGNVISIVNNFEVERVITSTYLKNTELEKEVFDTLKTKNIEIIKLDKIYKFALDGIKVITYPPFKEYNDYNDNSLVNAIYIGNTTFLFTGDVEKSRIKSLLKTNIGTFDVIKLPHHGETEENSVNFLKMVKPSYAIVTNDVLDEEIKTYLDNIGAKVYYTTREVHFITDGKTLRVSEA